MPTRARLSLFSCALVTAGISTACVQRPDAATCEAAGKHMISLYKKHKKDADGRNVSNKLGDKDLESFKKGCVERGTVKEVTCVQESASWSDVENCIR